jgi:type II secretory pathway component PulM
MWEDYSTRERVALVASLIILVCVLTYRYLTEKSR